MESRAHIAVYLLVPPVCVVIAIAMQLNAETGAFFFCELGNVFPVNWTRSYVFFHDSKNQIFALFTNFESTTPEWIFSDPLKTFHRFLSPTKFYLVKALVGRVFNLFRSPHSNNDSRLAAALPHLALGESLYNPSLQYHISQRRE
jgi:hypothetical protein